MKNNNKKSKIILLGTISTMSLAIVSIAVVACSSSNSPQEYVDAFENNNNAIKGINTISPSSLNALTYTTHDVSLANINNCFTGIVNPPLGSTATFNITTDTNSDINGTVNLTLILSTWNNGSVSTLTSKQITVGGFLTTNQNLINNYIILFENTSNNNTSSPDTNNIASIGTNIFPSSIPKMLTNSDINNYFTGMPNTPLGSTATFNVITNASSDLTGNVNLSVTLNAPNAQVTTSKIISISGFGSTIQNYIYTFNNSDNYDNTNNSTIIVGISTILPSNIPSTLASNNISEYFENTPKIPAGVTTTFKVTNVSNSSGTVTLSVILIYYVVGVSQQATASTNVSGFLSN